MLVSVRRSIRYLLALLFTVSLSPLQAAQEVQQKQGAPSTKRNAHSSHPPQSTIPLAPEDPTIVTTGQSDQGASNTTEAKEHNEATLTPLHEGLRKLSETVTNLENATLDENKECLKLLDTLDLDGDKKLGLKNRIISSSIGFNDQLSGIKTLTKRLEDTQMDVICFHLSSPEDLLKTGYYKSYNHKDSFDQIVQDKDLASDNNNRASLKDEMPSRAKQWHQNSIYLLQCVKDSLDQARKEKSMNTANIACYSIALLCQGQEKRFLPTLETSKPRLPSLPKGKESQKRKPPQEVLEKMTPSMIEANPAVHEHTIFLSGYSSMKKAEATIGQALGNTQDMSIKLHSLADIYGSDHLSTSFFHRRQLGESFFQIKKPTKRKKGNETNDPFFNLCDTMFDNMDKNVTAMQATQGEVAKYLSKSLDDLKVKIRDTRTMYGDCAALLNLEKIFQEKSHLEILSKGPYSQGKIKDGFNHCFLHSEQALCCHLKEFFNTSQAIEEKIETALLGMVKDDNQDDEKKDKLEFELRLDIATLRHMCPICQYTCKRTLLQIKNRLDKNEKVQKNFYIQNIIITVSSCLSSLP